ncbi:MAG: peptide-methionine (S)-S-oxide reductase MsrA [Thermoanaerobaculia bacterium]
MTNEHLETATLAGGCFWCVETIFERLRGVESVTSGYTGGHVANPTYQQVCTDTTGHAEAVQIVFDPAEVSYRELLEVFFAFHDPTTPDAQGNDVGSQYRSATFTHDEAQERTAREVIAALTEQGVFPDPIVTRVEPAGPFYPAEDYHQGYYRANPDQPYCRAVIAPKVAKLRQKLAARLREPVVEGA